MNEEDEFHTPPGTFGASDSPQTGSDRVKWSAMTHKGKVRTNNEDSFLALTVDGREVRYLGKTGQGTFAESDYVFAVSDGMGGAKSGEFASKIAVEKITRMFPRTYRHAAGGLPTGFGDVLTELFNAIHKELTRYGESYLECQGMGATLSLGWFTPGWMYFGHIGDSRVYYLPANGEGMRQVTHDDSHVGWLVRQGKLNEREARMHPRKNVISKALGAGHRYVDPQIGAVGCESGDRFVFCTDGLMDGLWDRAICEAIRKPSAAEQAHEPGPRLVLNALEASGRDNITAVVVEIG